MASDPLVLVVAGLVATWALLLAVVRPRLFAYLIFALAPTQFLFVPVADFFVSPADGLILLAGLGLLVRLSIGSAPAVTSLWQHRYLVVLGGVVLVGLLIHDTWVRTTVRLVMAAVPSLLAVEVLRTRTHLRRATVALIASGVLEVVYGLMVYYWPGSAYPARFVGMSGGWSGANLVATTILTAAAAFLAMRAQTDTPRRLIAPCMLGLFGFATLSKMAPIAFLAAWATVLRPLTSNVNKQRLAFGAVALIFVLLFLAPVREALWARIARGDRAGVALNSIDVRLMILGTAVQGAYDHPLVGVGFGRFMTYSVERLGLPLSSIFEAATHNTYLGLLVETGIVGLAVYLMHLLQFFKHAPTLYRRIVHEHDVTLGAAVAGLPVVLVSAVLNDLLLLYHFWAVCGLAFACVNVSRIEARRQPDAAGQPPR
jgi:hypothetical protein